MERIKAALLSVVAIAIFAVGWGIAITAMGYSIAWVDDTLGRPKLPALPHDAGVVISTLFVTAFVAMVAYVWYHQRGERWW